MAAIPSMRSSIRSSSSRGLQIGSSRSGDPFASYSGLQLNSAYDPAREARRFVAQQNPERIPSLCLILGDTLPYLRTALSERFPNTRLLSLYYHDQFPAVLASSFASGHLDRGWWPSRGADLETFLADELAGVDLTGILVLEWPPAARAFEDTARAVRDGVREYLRASAADRVTVAAFQRAWVDNLFANYLRVDRWYTLLPHRRTTLIAASGPSLERALPLIERYRQSLFLVSLPSSLSALYNRGMKPDVVVTVDAGYWARTHFESVSLQEVAVAMPLTASRGLWSQSASPVLLSTGSFLERELLQLAGISPHSIRDTGTVSATALELAHQLTDSPVIFAGLDLSYDGLSEHVRPHTFDTVLELQSRRLRPLPSVAFRRLHRIGLHRRPDGSSVTPAMSSYAEWFKRLSPPGQTYRLFPSRTALDGVSPVEPENLASLLSPQTQRETSAELRPLGLPPLRSRALQLEKMLDRWEKMLGSAKGSSTKALGPLFETLAPRDRLRQKHSGPTADQPADHEAALVSAALAEIARLRDRFLS